MKNKVYLALYKGRRSGTGFEVWKSRFGDWLTRKLTRGSYSHCELAVLRGNGLFDCYSSSIRDGGVRKKTMPLSDKWDLIEVDIAPGEVEAFYERTKGCKYDLCGAIGTKFNTPDNPSKWFCSEWCGAILRLKETWRFSPNDLFAIMTSSNEEALK